MSKKLEVQKIERDRLMRWINENNDFVLIDVLGEDSYEGRHLPKAKNVDLGKSTFLNDVEELVLDKKKQVVVYCASFDCHASTKASEKLIKDGYEEVYDFEGGIADWEDAGYPFEKQGQLIY
ncbi:MAG: rhodanese-like domain-containing protein [Candidatus Colwellbacteria bacterium CG10_big_fil_rev_8_21_14_0_10_41_28]|uniref:Rhodanese-like domain-containing protein n=1 Tax=Candidatus Colwellbacteria bacterium CG10_big_fil_rev_8_21_14_0_10_41_28 TaxID=1974539 RepID=A0A2H0VK39_9BACT|nr:MAG: rhodanese-like domain-containing protein [Candidatus Colwellbacteria bacterium CG10_big_fil_rev_8_21_14_0_10_41_28]